MSNIKTAKANVEPVRQRTQYSWAEQPLGQVPDQQIALELGCRRQTVIAVRQRLGIPPFDSTRSNKGIEWDNVGLGLRSDADIAADFGVAQVVVTNARNRRGIAPFTLRCAPVDWVEVPFGTLPDSALAEIYGVSQATVTRHRNQRGVAPFNATFLTSEGEVAASLGEALIDLYWHEQRVDHTFQVQVGPYVADWVSGDGTIVEFAGFIESRAYGERYKARLDQKVAYYKSIGRQVQVIYPADLSAFQPKGQVRTTDAVVSGGIDWKKQPLGTVPDARLAKKLGVCQSTVTRWRNLLNIDPHRSRHAA